MKKVLFITSISGFLPQFEQNDVKLLKKMGCEIHYASNFQNPVYTFNEKDLTDQGIILHHIDIEKSPAKIIKNTKAVMQLKKIIDNYEIDLIHCHNPLGGLAGRFSAQISKKKPYVIYTAHGFHFYKGASFLNWLLFYPAEKFMARFTDCLITINQEDYERACRFRLKKGGSAHQIHSVGVDKHKFAPHRELEEEKRKELSVPQNAFHIVTAAELNDNKNQKVIIHAIHRLPEKDIYYSICGKGSNQEFLTDLIKKYGLEDRVRLLGFRTDMEEVLQTADCFAFPSYREGLGVAAIEALLCGVPLIVSKNRGTREYAREGENAFCLDVDDEAGFAAAIASMYRNRKVLEKLGQNARASAMNFTVEEVEKTMSKIYQHALEISDNKTI